MKPLVAEKQEKAVNKIQNLWAGGRFPHAILVEGGEGDDKNNFAKFIAMKYFCERKDSPCGECISCQKTEKGANSDLFITDGLEPKIYKIDNVREIIESTASFPSKYDIKVYIFTEIQNMDKTAQNTLLKIIEEPPEHVRFIFTCSKKGEVITTILSRVTVISLFENEEIIENELANKIIDYIIKKDELSFIKSFTKVEEGKDSRDNYNNLLREIRKSSLLYLEEKKMSSSLCKKIIDIIDEEIENNKCNIGISISVVRLVNKIFN